jgi:hypothetical protein
MNGTYRVVIDGDGESTGDYKFRLFNKATVTPVQFDTEVTGNFANNGIESDVYRFAGVAGHSVYLDTGNGQAANSWILYGPGGQRITSGFVQDNYYDDYEFVLPTTGEYLLVMQGNGAENVNYRFRLVTPELLSAPLTLGTTTSGSISKAGEQDTYTFSGTIGQQLFFDALIGNSSLKARLIGPSGVVLLDKETSSDWGAFNLTETGTYHLVIDGDRTTTGDYRFTLIDRAKAPALVLGTATAGSLNPGNRVNLYQFTGQNGQRFKFDLEAASWSGANWILYDPNGGVVKAPTSNNPDFTATLGENGVYTLAVIGSSDAAVNYSFQVTDISGGRVSTTGLEDV